MRTETEEFLLSLLQACAARAPEPLYPGPFSREQILDRSVLDAGLDDLRRRGLVQFTEWMKDLGQGYALTDAGRQALATNRLPTAPVPVTTAARDDAFDPLERGEIVRESLYNSQRPYVTRILLALNILYFAYGAFYASRDPALSVSDYMQGKSSKTTNVVLIELGALHPALVQPAVVFDGVRQWRYERIILFLFLHIGLFHLFMNMYFLYSIAQQIEGLWGSGRFLLIYAVAGIVSGCVVILLSQFEQTSGLTAGASGCLYGVFAALVVWYSLNKQYLPERMIHEWTRMLATNLLILVVINFLPGISWQGHFGGAVGGFLAALLLHVQRFHPSRTIRILALIGVPLVPLAFFAAVLWQVNT